ncbi:hypothetical protein R1CP_23600 [Rhodococcus opacus]|uniref:Smf/DprA SLOG domain-containing protein n=1 Tax=Rhodococcus opacus TaxID=37919 RepID=A0A1B1K9Y4_RHOOP|nr:DNA-processing protein DprA [Rhodococcus opacus]ANS29388.1 hypothetical protein R1CP_23600 [Rhodococcus opacus]
MSFESNLKALVAFADLRTPARIAKGLADGGVAALRQGWGNLDAETRSGLEAQAADLDQRGVSAVLFGDDGYPASLIAKGRPVAPVLFTQGDTSLLHASGAGMCGSRKVSPLGLKAAFACGDEVSRRGLAVISGYAKGVDTETHLAALNNGGRTVIVLAEGINHFSVKRAFKEAFDPERVLVVSQFHPQQPWGAYAAMARNHIIFGLGKALVVIEAGEKGGTLAAGKDALKRGRPVFVLNFGDDTPPGNAVLLEMGGRPVTSRTELGVALDELGDVSDHVEPAPPEQASLDFEAGRN